MKYLILISFSLITLQMNFALLNINESKKVKIGIIDVDFVSDDGRLDKFLNKSSDISDSQYVGDHGVIVSEILIKELVAKGIDFEIYACDWSKSDVTKCLQYMEENGVDYLNLSLAGDLKIKEEEIQLRKMTNISLISVSAGNEGQIIPQYPCGYSVKNMKCVGSLDSKGIINESSNHGPHVAVYEVGEQTSFSAPMFLAKEIVKFEIGRK